MAWNQCFLLFSSKFSNNWNCDFDYQFHEEKKSQRLKQLQLLGKGSDLLVFDIRKRIYYNRGNFKTTDKKDCVSEYG